FLALATVGMADPAVFEFFEHLLIGRSWQERVLALDAAAASRDLRFGPKVISNLGHRIRQVRLAAAEALAHLRSVEAIEPLIVRLEKEEDKRILNALAEALYRTTGMNLYDQAAVWRKWWKANREGFRVPEYVKDLPSECAGGTRAGFYGIPINSEHIAFVLDQSGSMSAGMELKLPGGRVKGNRLTVAVRQLLKAVRELPDCGYVNVILFHTSVQPWRGDLQRLTRKNRKELSRYLRSKTPMGGTNLYDAMERALDDEDVDTIFVLSDGAPTAGKYTDMEDILRVVRRKNQIRRIVIHTISVGQDSALLRRLAEENGGRYVRV
ncbi:MAG: VWA domain-containing protein, partial [Planctomycetota bacterium]